MKMLTLHQPWASLIAVGVKTIETRSWSTPYRGPLAIHAGKARPPTTQWEEGPFDDIGHYAPTAADPEGTANIHQYGAWIDDETRGVRGWWLTLGPNHDDYHPLPLGAVVAVADLVDVVPINEHPARPFGPNVYEGSHGNLTLRRSAEQVWPEDVEAQRPFGDFTSGRYAWLLDNVHAVEPIPAKGHQGLRDAPADVWQLLTYGVQP